VSSLGSKGMSYFTSRRKRFQLALLFYYRVTSFLRHVLVKYSVPYRDLLRRRRAL
jgi:hypothetical protein